MGKTVDYEWAIEQHITYDERYPEDYPEVGGQQIEEIVDAMYHADKFKDLPALNAPYRDEEAAGVVSEHYVLIRDDWSAGYGGRAWAYATAEGMPETFEDAGRPTSIRVPKRFIQQYDRAQK